MSVHVPRKLADHAWDFLLRHQAAFYVACALFAIAVSFAALSIGFGVSELIANLTRLFQ